MLKQAAVVLALFLLLEPGCAAERPVPVEKKDMVSYSLGFQIGRDFRKEHREIDSEAFLQGLRDSLAQKNPAVDPGAMQASLLQMKKKIIARQRREMQEMREQRLGEGKKFFAENAAKEGVVTLPSGLQYRVIKAGQGRKPGFTDRVAVFYRGTLIDGTAFGGTRNPPKPDKFYVNGVIPGLTEGLQLMREGAKWEFFIPPELGYGGRGALADRAVIFDVELLSIEPPE